MTWDQYFLNLAKTAASKSKDPSTKVGAVIVAKNNTVVSMGYNGLAKQMLDSPERYEIRELKYRFVIHAEMNAMIHARRTLNGCTLYTYPLPCCEACSIHLIQSGVVRFVSPAGDIPERWMKSIMNAYANIKEAKADWDRVSMEESK